jgi:glycosyltransferase involved in cell wall biosynthesis
MRLLLSICIPTYNRITDLILNLDKISEQLSSNDHTMASSFELIISVNNSNAETYKLVMEHMINKLVKTRIQFHSDNIGATRNLFSAIDVADGQYVLILGDDDYLPESYLDVLYKYLLNVPEIAAVMTNSIQVDQDYTQISRRFLKSNKDKIIHNRLKYFYIPLASNISGLVFKKEIYKDALNLLSPNNRYPHRLLFGLALNKGSLLVLGSQIVKITLRDDFSLKYMKNPILFLENQIEINHQVLQTYSEVIIIDIITVLGSGFHRLDESGSINFTKKLVNSKKIYLLIKIFGIIVIIVDNLMISVKRFIKKLIIR